MDADGDLAAVRLTVELASVTTLILLLVGTPIAWWLSATRSRWKAWVAAVVALPLVLPPAVLGFYLLVCFGPHGPGGRLTRALGLGTLPFTFSGLALASTIYSLPFVVQPLHSAFEGVGARPLEVAATLGAGAWDRFFTVAVPLASSGFYSAAILAFAHTVGELGVVLMIGGNIPGKTRVLSVALYDHVEALEYPEVHRLAAGLLIFALSVLALLQTFRARPNPL